MLGDRAMLPTGQPCPGLVKERPLGQAQRIVPVPCPMPGDVAAPMLLVLSPCQGHLPPHCGTWHSPGTRTIPCQAQHPGPDADGHTWEQGGLQRAANSAVVLSPLSIVAGAPMDAGGQRHQMMTAMSPSSHSCWTTGVFHPTAWG